MPPDGERWAPDGRNVVTSVELGAELARASAHVNSRELKRTLKRIERGWVQACPTKDG